MQKAFLLCNNKHRQIVRSEKPLEKVRLLSFEYKETDSNDLSPFTFECVFTIHLGKSFRSEDSSLLITIETDNQ